MNPHGIRQRDIIGVSQEDLFIANLEKMQKEPIKHNDKNINELIQWQVAVGDIIDWLFHYLSPIREKGLLNLQINELEVDEGPFGKMTLKSLHIELPCQHKIMLIPRVLRVPAIRTLNITGLYVINEAGKYSFCNCLGQLQWDQVRGWTIYSNITKQYEKFDREDILEILNKYFEDVNANT